MRILPRAIHPLSAGLLAAVLGSSALSGQVSGELGKVLRVQGVVKVTDPQGPRTLRPDHPILLDQTIRTRQDSAIEMIFNRDGRLLLWPSTTMVLRVPSRERHPDCNPTVAARIELRRGSIQVDHDPKQPLKPLVLEIETDHARICLFGTSIQVYVDPERGTWVYVQETGAWVRPLKGGDWVRLEANEQAFGRGEKLRVTGGLSRLTLLELEGEPRFHDSPLFDPIVF
jgi:hypothetical protein